MLKSGELFKFERDTITYKCTDIKRDGVVLSFDAIVPVENGDLALVLRRDDAFYYFLMRHGVCRYPVTHMRI